MFQFEKWLDSPEMVRAFRASRQPFDMYAPGVLDKLHEEAKAREAYRRKDMDKAIAIAAARESRRADAFRQTLVAS